MANILKPQPGPQTKFLSTPADICIYGGGAGGGKAQPLDEPVLTPDGFIPMGSIDIGDTVTTPYGVSTVAQIHPQGIVPIFRVLFEDGTYTRCTFEHLWHCYVGGEQKLYSCGEIIELLKKELYIEVPVYDSELPFEDMRRKHLISVIKNGLDECQCITLDDPRGLYVTRDNIITHNSFGLLMTALRYKNVPGFGCTIFRKNFNQIFSQGGLWDESLEIYGKIKGAVPKPNKGEWQFLDKDGNLVSKVNFAHIERDVEVLNWQGTQIAELCFDELTHFSKKIFFYMLSRNRSSCGVKPFVRATCNPDSDSWVAEFIDWWIDPETGYPIKERSGKIRWFIQRDETLYWADTKEELWERFDLKTEVERAEPRSVTFIMSLLTDNKALMEVNPSYISNLKALPEVERERLLNGNWKIKAAAGMFFKRSQLGDVLPTIPLGVNQWVRCWDLAATEKTSNGDPAYTAGVLIGKQPNGRYIVADVINRQMAAVDVRKTILMTAAADREKYGRVRVRLPKDPGQAGKEQAETYIKMLAGYDVVTVIESGSKESRAEPVAAQWQAGNFDIVAGAWNEPFLYQLENFPDGKFKDMVDAFSNGFTELETKNAFNVRNLI